MPEILPAIGDEVGLGSEPPLVGKIVGKNGNGRYKVACRIGDFELAGEVDLAEFEWSAEQKMWRRK